MSSNVIKNWAGTKSWKPEAIVHPEDEEQIVKLIEQTLKKDQCVKALGSALSWSDIIDIPSIAIQFDKMAPVVEVDSDQKRVRVQAGMRLKDVNEVLAQHGMAFDNFGSIVLQTAAGYISTGTHGTGIRTRILSSFIEEMRLIDGLGHVHELSATNEPEILSAARVNLGCLGIITEITLKCVEAFDLEERLELVEFDRVLADLDAYLEQNDYCKLWWLPYTKEIQVYTFNRTQKPRTGFTFRGWMDECGLSGALFTGLMVLSRTAPRLIPRVHNTVQKIHFHPRTRVDRSDKVIKYAGTIPIHQETEYAIPVARAATAIEETRQLVMKADYRVNFPVEVRFVKGDNIPMSPACGRDSCYIGAYVASLDWAPPYFDEFQALMRNFEGRPHWGKSFKLTAEDLRTLYPAFDEFKALRQRMDPHGLFRNSFVDRVFPSEGS